MRTVASFDIRQSRMLDMTRHLGQAIGLLKFTNRELASFLAFHAAANPFLVLQPAAAPPDAPARRVASAASRGGERGVEERAVAGEAGLYEHARREVGLVLKSPAERRIAEHFIEALEPSGWLGRPVEEIAAEAGCAPAEAEAVLARIQRIDPPGLFARSLAECLRLQAEGAGLLTERLACILDNLPLLAQGDLAGLAARCGCAQKEVLEDFATIRGFNPKPGADLGAAPPPEMPPDLIVTRQGGRWEIEINRSSLPVVTLTERAGLSETDRRMLEAAKSVARAVERRNITTLKIAAELVRRQGRFLAEGPAQLRPLSHRDIAEAVGVHASTVSRVSAGMRVAVPAGVVAMQDFFSTAVAGPPGGEAVAAGAVRALIAGWIRDEGPERPLTDAALRTLLAERGIRVARRTVAKYREQLGLPSSADRQGRAARAAPPCAAADARRGRCAVPARRA